MRKTDNFQNCLEILKNADFLRAGEDDIYRTGIIGQFGLTFELAWKALQGMLREYSVMEAETGSPREILKAGYGAGWISDPEVWLLMLKKSKMVVRRVEMGSFSHMAKRYIRKTLQETRNIDRRILFITYAGLDKEKLQYIKTLVQQYCTFERVYLQKASSAIASNCGPGSFGLLFMRRDDVSHSFFEVPNQNGAA